MNRFLRFYNQNRRTFWLVVAIVIMVLGIIRLLNNYAKELNKKSSSSNTTTYSAISQNPNYSVITEEIVDEKQADFMVNTIKAFLNYCNLGLKEKAYNMLSEDCKNSLFKTQQEFEDNYYNIVFKTKKTFKYQAWITETNKTIYKIELDDDILSTGTLNSNKQEDYFTVINENGVYRLNINKYIGHVDINKQVLSNDIRITVLSKDIYLENVIYNFKVENFSEADIVLDTQENGNIIYLQDSRGLMYLSAIWELTEQNLFVYSKSIKNVSIKFLAEYNPKYYEKCIIFNSIKQKYQNQEKILSIKIDMD